MPKTKSPRKSAQRTATLNDLLKRKHKQVKDYKLTTEDLRSYIKKRPQKKSYGVVQSFMRQDFKEYLATTKSSKEKPLVVDLGTFNRRFYSESINIDIFQEGDTDLVWDITTELPIESGSVDFVVCSAVLEHVNEPAKVIREMHRILKPGGRVWVDIPFMQPYHESPDDFYRFTLSGIKHMFKEFTIHKSGAIPGSGFTIHWMLKEFAAILEWEKLHSIRKYPRMKRLLSKRSLNRLKNELLKFDTDLETKFGREMPHSFHITASGVYVYGEK